METSSLFNDLLLLRLPETGATTYWRLLEEFDNTDKILQQPLSRLAQWLKPAALAALADCKANPDTNPLMQRIRKDLNYLEANSHIKVIRFNQPEYPRLLREIPRPPVLLFVRGDVNCLSLPQVAIVGSRNPSQTGSDNAEQFAEYLAQCGFAICSGLALGIDAAAHRGALHANGKTIAVMGTGIDQIYPARHKLLAEQIVAAGGAIISEFPPGTSAHSSNFPQRNRIISGLSGGTLVVEAAVQSGSLITADYALQHNREVFAIPGSIHNPLARGCHQLIREGATLVETAKDIVDQLAGLVSYKRQELLSEIEKSNKAITKEKTITRKNTAAVEPPIDVNEVEQQILNALGYDPADMDLLLERTSLSIGNLSACLIELEIKGLVQQVGGSYQRC
jgi:DNA processing protein